MRRLLPDTLAARTLLVLIVGLTVSHLLSVALFLSDRTGAIGAAEGEHAAERIATITRMVDGASPEERPQIVRLAEGPGQRVSWSQEGPLVPAGAGGSQEKALARAFSEHLGSLADRPLTLATIDEAQSAWLPVEGAGNEGEILSGSLMLTDGSWLNFTLPIGPPAPFWTLRTTLSMVIMLLAVAAFSALVVRQMTRPLARFARVAERLGTDVRAPAIPEAGPREVRQAARAFNEMQSRIRRFVEDRTAMLAAISHDLGTPITRMRLRTEFVEDDEQRSKMLTDLDDMEQMVSAALSFARDDTAGEAYATIDLRSLVHRVCDDLVDAGHDVTCQDGDEAIRLGCRPGALRRALSNLIQNAVRYGHRARVSVESGNEEVLIEIEDDGPGIPEDLQEEAFKPFRRLETSRSRETGGTGLGLAVARTIVRGHGGQITLKNRCEGGLSVQVELPRGAG